MMICPKCGKENEDETLKCTHCGAEMSKASPGEETKREISISKVLLEKLKALPKLVRWGGAAAVVLIVALITVCTIGSSMSNPQNVIKGYYQAQMNRQYDKMYDALELKNTDYINKDAFIKYMQSMEGKQGKIVSFEIGENPFLSDSSQGYLVSYLVEGSTSKEMQSITPVKQEGKQWLFFDSYKLNVDKLTTDDFKISAPAGSTVSLDGIPMAKAQSSEKAPLLDSTDETFTISQMFGGQHHIKVENPYCEPWEQDVDLGTDTYYSIPEMTLKESLRTDLSQKAQDDFKKICASAVIDDSFDKIGLNVTDNNLKLSGLKGEYNRFVFNTNSFGARIKSVNIEFFTDASEQKEWHSSSDYTCKLEVQYTYVKEIKSYLSDAVTEKPSDGPQKANVALRYTLENSQWVLSEMALPSL